MLTCEIGVLFFVVDSGYICIALPGDRLAELDVPMMVPDNQERHRTAYTVTVDYKHGKDRPCIICLSSDPLHVLAPIVLGCMDHLHLRRLNTPPLGTSTGISAYDRSTTVRALASPSSTPDDFTRPGHMVPLRARDGGVLTRKGHTESAVDLCLLTDQPQAGVLCELVNDDAQGSMARRDDCRAFADRWGLKMISVEMLVEYRRRQVATNGVSK